MQGKSPRFKYGSCARESHMTVYSCRDLEHLSCHFDQYDDSLSRNHDRDKCSISFLCCVVLYRGEADSGFQRNSMASSFPQFFAVVIDIF